MASRVSASRSPSSDGERNPAVTCQSWDSRSLRRPTRTRSWASLLRITTSKVKWRGHSASPRSARNSAALTRSLWCALAIQVARGSQVIKPTRLAVRFLAENLLQVQPLGRVG